MKLTNSNIFSLLFILNTIPSINQWSKFEIGNTFVWWLCSAMIFLYILKINKAQKKYDTDTVNFTTVKLLIGWNLISICRGFFVAENYWEWKNLVSTTFVLLIPMFALVMTQPTLLRKLTKDWLTYALPFFFVFIPLIKQSDFIGRYLIPISFLCIFFPILPMKWKIIVLFFTAVVVGLGLDARSNILRFAVTLSLGSLFYFKKYFGDFVLKFIHLLFLALPLLFFYLAVTGMFNIFKLDEYLGDITIQSSFGSGNEQKLSEDTRTLIYYEAINSAVGNEYLLLGRTPARGYDSQSFGNFLANELQTGKMERFSSEVCVLNLFTWNGILGVLLYFLVFANASYLAVYKSNNFFIKIVGIYVAYRWMYSFVEEFTNFDLSYIYSWIFIAMCFSKQFRTMTNDDMIVWVRDTLPWIRKRTVVHVG